MLKEFRAGFALFADLQTNRSKGDVWLCGNAGFAGNAPWPQCCEVHFFLFSLKRSRFPEENKQTFRAVRETAHGHSLRIGRDILYRRLTNSVVSACATHSDGVSAPTLTAYLQYSDTILSRISTVPTTAYFSLSRTRYSVAFPLKQQKKKLIKCLFLSWNKP